MLRRVKQLIHDNFWPDPAIISITKSCIPGALA